MKIIREWRRRKEWWKQMAHMVSIYRILLEFSMVGAMAQPHNWSIVLGHMSFSFLESCFFLLSIFSLYRRWTFLSKHLLCSMRMVFLLFSWFNTLALQIERGVKKEGHGVSKRIEGWEKKFLTLLSYENLSWIYLKSIKLTYKLRYVYHLQTHV
jgi:hypothetical protein